MYGNMALVFSYLPDTSLEYLIGVLMESTVLILPGKTYSFLPPRGDIVKSKLKSFVFINKQSYLLCIWLSCLIKVYEY